MSQDGLKALEAQLGASAPAGVARLSASQLRALSSAVMEARHQQAAELAAASDQALKHIPKLLRMPIRRMFG
jgi:hypothetical protein